MSVLTAEMLEHSVTCGLESSGASCGRRTGGVRIAHDGVGTGELCSRCQLRCCWQRTTSMVKVDDCVASTSLAQWSDKSRQFFTSPSVNAPSNGLLKPVGMTCTLEKFLFPHHCFSINLASSTTAPDVKYSRDERRGRGNAHTARVHSHSQGRAMCPRWSVCDVRRDCV